MPERWGNIEGLKIRRYEPEDRETVRRLHDVALRDAGAHAEDEDLEGGGEFLVGLYEGWIVAMGALRPMGPGRAEIKRMRVEPDFQRRGFGQQVLTALEERAAALGYTRLHLDTTVRQRAARGLYARNGYREVRRGSIGPFECVFYEKALPGVELSVAAQE
jgi:GNAT superfamily N-acetyltransferase